MMTSLFRKECQQNFNCAHTAAKISDECYLLYLTYCVVVQFLLRSTAFFLSVIKEE
jgi:hypothetical protein